MSLFQVELESSYKFKEFNYYIERKNYFKFISIIILKFFDDLFKIQVKAHIKSLHSKLKLPLFKLWVFKFFHSSLIKYHTQRNILTLINQTITVFDYIIHPSSLCFTLRYHYICLLSYSRSIIIMKFPLIWKFNQSYENSPKSFSIE